MIATHFCLVRHGETPGMPNGASRGTPTSASTRKGASGGAGGRWLAAGEARPAHLYSSDLLRARLTAEPLAAALGLPIRYVPALRERRYGIFEGLTYDEARARFPDDYAAFEHREPDYAFPHGGESLRTFFARVTGRWRPCMRRIRAKPWRS